MATAPQSRQFTEDEYLDLEMRSAERHEYERGQVFQMVGASRAHNLINSNLAMLIAGQLRGKPCELYVNDMRVKVAARNAYFYPDVAVACPPIEIEHRRGAETLQNPVVLIEVLSPSTEAYDRGDKFERYMQLPSLREYLMVSQATTKIDHYVRGEGGQWRLRLHTNSADIVELESIRCALLLSDVYEKVTFPPKLLEETDEPNA